MAKSKKAMFDNIRVYNDYLSRLSRIARKRYEWKNLPNYISERWIENFLIREGRCVFFKDEKMGLMVSSYTNNGNLNMYGEPTTVMPYGIGYQGRNLTVGKDCIIIKNDDDYRPSISTLELYADRLAKITRCIDNNVSIQKFPFIVVCEEKQKLTMKNVINQVEENELCIYGSKNFDVENIKVLNTNAPIVFDKLEIQKKAIWNECMTYLGVNNANQDKRERLVADEVQANNEQIDINTFVGLEARKESVKLINEMFGTNIEVTQRLTQIRDEVQKGSEE